MATFVREVVPIAEIDELIDGLVLDIEAVCLAELTDETPDDLDDEPLLERADPAPPLLDEPPLDEPPDDFEPEDFEPPDFEPPLEDELERELERDLDLLERELRPPPRLAIMNFVYNAN